MDPITESTAQVHWAIASCVDPDTVFTVYTVLVDRDQCNYIQIPAPASPEAIDVTGGQVDATVGSLFSYSTYMVTVTVTLPSGVEESVSNMFITSQAGNRLFIILETTQGNIYDMLNFPKKYFIKD